MGGFLFVDRELRRETAWSRIHLVPLLLAEGDRDAYRREQAARAREREIMKDVRGWEIAAGGVGGRVTWDRSNVGGCGRLFGSIAVCCGGKRRRNGSCGVWEWAIDRAGYDAGLLIGYGVRGWTVVGPVGTDGGFETR
ncbi:hypothetical protein RhiLY_01017 [Ceratobasidium sp. AG-Ba]|nr:hypothetical protein RhiLY_01017 [Ceratobasidium sp. AG-Ba]